ncbi:MAG: hypothetical protein PHX83_06660 [Acidobacteriia bacterium]|nr:hypothetical protein [Terriglobia bacterium]
MRTGAAVAVDTRRVTELRPVTSSGEVERLRLHVARQAEVIRRQEQRIADLIDLAERQRDELDRAKARD